MLRSRLMRLGALVAAVAAMPLALAAGASASASTRAPESPLVTALNWQPCPYPGSPASLQCARVPVPVDYAHPNGPKTFVVIDRLQAADPARRIGDLVFNPGGPGGSGTELVYGEALGKQLFTPAVRQRYDLIGLDPRGVALSDPIRCSATLFNQVVNLFPRNRTQFDRLRAHNRALGESCRKLSGPLAAHVDTISVARDLDVIRADLGQPRLDYLGLSYGTEIGSEYASLYPHNVGRMALDGALDHSLGLPTMVRQEGATYATELRRWGNWCEHAAACPLHGRHPLQVFARVTKAADRHPIRATGCSTACRRTVTGQDIRQEAQGLVLFKPASVFSPGWAGLGAGLAAAAHGNAKAFSLPRATSNADPTISASGLAVECQDFPSHLSYRALRALGDRARRANPLTGGLSQSYEIAAECDGWPLKAQNPPRLLPRRHTAPILIVNATHDPSTSYVWAKGLHRQLADSVLLTRRGDGHTSYFLTGATRTAESAYLTAGTLPRPGTVLDN